MSPSSTVHGIGTMAAQLLIADALICSTGCPGCGGRSWPRCPGLASPQGRRSHRRRSEEAWADLDAQPSGMIACCPGAGSPASRPRPFWTPTQSLPPSANAEPGAARRVDDRLRGRAENDHRPRRLRRRGVAPGDRQPDRRHPRHRRRRGARQWWWPCRPRVSTGVAPGRVHCGTGRLVGPQVAFPSASERQNQHELRPSGQPSGLSSHASPRP